MNCLFAGPISLNAELKFHVFWRCSIRISTGNPAIMTKALRVFLQFLQINSSMIHRCRLSQDQFLPSFGNILLTNHSNILETLTA
jgi:hypothetical protein